MSTGLVRVGDMLVEAGVITREQLGEALRHQQANGGRLGTNLVELGFLDEKTLATFLAKQLSIPSVSAAQIDRIPAGLTSLVPAQMAERLRTVPVREDQGRLWVAMADPTDRAAVQELERVSHRPVRVLVAPELLIQYALEKYYGVKRQTRARVVEVRTGHSDLLKLDKSLGNTPPPARGMPQAGPGEAPVYLPIEMESDQIEAVTGYIDESPQIAQPARGAPPERLTMKSVIEQLVAATTDEVVLDVAARFLVQGIPKVWVFLIKQSELVSWGGRGCDARALAGVRVPLAELGLVAQSLSTGEVLAGRLQPAALGRLANPLGVYSETLGMILPVRIGKHAVGVIFGVDATLDAMRQKPEIDKLAQKLDQALHINYLRRLLATP